MISAKNERRKKNIIVDIDLRRPTEKKCNTILTDALECYTKRILMVAKLRMGNA